MSDAGERPFDHMHMHIYVCTHMLMFELAWRAVHNLTRGGRSKFVAFVFVQGLDSKHPKNWIKVS